MIFVKFCLILLSIRHIRSQGIAFCDQNNICRNGGTCLILNNIDIICKCSPDFTGNILKNEFKVKIFHIVIIHFRNHL